MWLDHNLIGVMSHGGSHGVEAEVVAEDQANPHQTAQLPVVRGIDAGRLEALVRMGEEGRLPPAAGDLAQAVDKHGPADPDRAQGGCPGGPLQEAQAAEPVSGLAVEGHRDGLAPGL
jgi:hypothetical protein